MIGKSSIKANCYKARFKIGVTKLWQKIIFKQIFNIPVIPLFFIKIQWKTQKKKKFKFPGILAATHVFYDYVYI